MENVIERVWQFKRLIELSPLAAAKALSNKHLFSTKTLWGHTMDPTKTDELFYPDGQITQLTVAERSKLFPFPMSFPCNEYIQD